MYVRVCVIVIQNYLSCCMWQFGIKCDRKANRNETRVDRRGISPRLSTYRRDTKRQRFFLLPAIAIDIFALPRYFQS